MGRVRSDDQAEHPRGNEKRNEEEGGHYSCGGESRVSDQTHRTYKSYC